MTIFHHAKITLFVIMLALWHYVSNVSVALAAEAVNLNADLPTLHDVFSQFKTQSTEQTLPQTASSIQPAQAQPSQLFDSSSVGPKKDMQPAAQVPVPTLQPQPTLTGLTASKTMLKEEPVTIDTTANDSKEAEDIYLNFENSMLSSVVNYIAEQKKINIIPHKDLETTTVSLSTRTALTPTRAWNVLLTLMEMNGFSMVKVGDVYRVVASRDNGLEPLPIYSSAKGMEPEDLPDSDQIVRYVYFFKNIKIDIAQGILRQMLEGDNNTVIANQDLNACVIKHQCNNIKAVMRIIKALDTGGLSESIKVIQLKYIGVDLAYKIFSEILGQQSNERIIKISSITGNKETSFFSANTRLIPEPINNLLIMLGTEKNLVKITDFIAKYIDIPQESAASRLHIKEIKYARAEQLKPIIENIISPPRGQGADKSALVGEYKFFEDVLVTAEEPKDERSGYGGGNRLIVAAGKDDWIRLERLIDKLDKPQPQVAIEVMIISTDIKQDNSLGAQMFNIKGKKAGLGIDMIEFKNLSGTNNLTSDQSPQYINDVVKNLSAGAPSFMTFGRAATTLEPESNNLWGVVRALCNLDNSHIISQPFLVANNYQTCKVNVDATRRVPGALVDSSRLSDTRRRQESVTASTSVSITPKINRDGIVDLQIDITLDEFLETGVADKPPMSNRELHTRTIMGTGEVIALGGFLTKSDRVEQYKTPILSDIPFIGSLFRSKEVSRQDQNVYVFIRPSIIQPRFEGAPDEYTQLKLDYAKYQSTKNDTYAKEKDPIQRWFFKPMNQTTRHTIADARRGIYRPIDDFTYGRARPRSVNVQLDPYYKVSTGLQQEQEKQKQQSLQRARKKQQPKKAISTKKVNNKTE